MTESDQTPREIKQRPVVSIEIIKKEKVMNGAILVTFLINDATQTPIGSFELELVYDWNKVRNIWHSTPAEDITIPAEIAMINSIMVDTDYKGKGYGKATYLKLLDFLGPIPLMSGTTLTGWRGSDPGSYQVWLSLVKDGRAIVVPQPNMSIDGFISIPTDYTGTAEQLIDRYRSET